MQTLTNKSQRTYSLLSLSLARPPPPSISIFKLLLLLCNLEIFLVMFQRFLVVSELEVGNSHEVVDRSLVFAGVSHDRGRDMADLLEGSLCSLDSRFVLALVLLYQKSHKSGLSNESGSFALTTAQPLCVKPTTLSELKWHVSYGPFMLTF